MAAAFLLEEGRSKGISTAFSREIEEEGIKFSVENATEDIINGLFCTYEPPTSKLEQYKAARAFRKDPKMYATRPSVPKSILKWKFKKAKKKKEPPPSDNASNARSTTTPTIETRDDAGAADSSEKSVVAYGKKSVTWRDEKSQEERTEMENTVVGLAAKYCGGACNDGEGIAEIMSSPTGRAAQKFFGEASSIFGAKKEVDTAVSGDNTDKQADERKKIFYDDLGNPIREDDVQSTGSSSNFFSTPKAIEAAPTPSNPSAPPLFSSNANDPKKGGHQNLFCSNIPFMDTVIEGIGIAGVVAANAAVAAGVPENLCGAYTVKKPTHTRDNSLILVPRQSAEQAQISEELRLAQESLGIYEPKSYDQPSEKSGSFKMKRQSTPKHTPGSQNLDGESQREPPESTRSTDPSKTGDQSYATSDITMGNSTVQHFKGDVSLFDETVNKENASLPGKYSSVVEELKSVQRKKKLGEGSDQRSSVKVGSSVASPSVASVKSLREGYEKSAKSPKGKSVVTNSYINSLKSPSSSSRPKGADSPRTGTVASLAKQFESPRSFVPEPTMPNSARKGVDPGVRKSIDPSESRNHDGTVHLLPPTPRRKKKTVEPPSTNDNSKYFGGELPPTPRRRSGNTPTGYSMVNNELRMRDWDDNSSNNNNNNNNNNDDDAEAEATKSAVTVNTDAEIREAASSILDVGTRWKPRSSNKGRMPKSLVKGPETVEDEDEDAVEATEEKETKKEKKKKKRSKFADKLKKVLEPVANATRKVESQRIQS